MNNNLFMTRAAMKATARKRLSQPGLRLKLAVAMIIPVVVTLIMGVLVSLEFNRVSGSLAGLSDADFMTTMQNLSTDIEKRQLFSGIASFYFLTGVSLTTLDVVRDPNTHVSIGGIMFKLFNGTYFFSMLIMYILTTLIISIGSAFFYIPGIIFSLALSMVYFLLYDARQRGDARGAFTIMGDSWRLMRGYKADLFIMYLSFIPWYFLSVITMGLANLYVEPYINATLAVFYEQVRMRYAADNPDSHAADGPQSGGSNVG